MSTPTDDGVVNIEAEVNKPEYTLQAVPPLRLKDYWPSIREAVASIEQPDHGIPEEIYAMCFTNGATLFRLMKDDQQIGYMVVRMIPPDLHIWQVSAENGYEVLKLFRSALLKLATDAGARAITFGSSRKAWQKVAAEHGFVPRMVVYELPL